MNPRRSTGRHGFTLIELLISIGILGVLAGLLLPGVQKVRGSFQRAACANNLRQIGLAAVNHQQSYGRLPVAIVMPYAQQAAKPSITDASGLPPVEVVNDSAARKNS